MVESKALCRTWQALVTMLHLTLVGLVVASKKQDLLGCFYTAAGQQECEHLCAEVAAWGSGSGLQCVQRGDSAACLAALAEATVDFVLPLSDDLSELPRGLALVDMYSREEVGSGVTISRQTRSAQTSAVTLEGPAYAWVEREYLCQQKLAIGFSDNEPPVVCQTVGCVQTASQGGVLVPLSMLESLGRDLEIGFRMVCPSYECLPVHTEPCWHWQAPRRSVVVNIASSKSLPLEEMAFELDRVEATSALRRAVEDSKHGNYLLIQKQGAHSDAGGYLQQQGALRQLLQATSAPTDTQSPTPAPIVSTEVPTPTGVPTPAPPTVTPAAPDPAPVAPTPKPPEPTPGPPVTTAALPVETPAPVTTPGPPTVTPAPPVPTPVPPVPTPAPPVPTPAPPVLTPAPTAPFTTPAPPVVTPAPTIPPPTVPPPTLPSATTTAATAAPTIPATAAPTLPPTLPPVSTAAPTLPPTTAPTVVPTPAPTTGSVPTPPPTLAPTFAPTVAPTTSAPIAVATPDPTPAGTSLAPVTTLAPSLTPASTTTPLVSTSAPTLAPTLPPGTSSPPLTATPLVTTPAPVSLAPVTTLPATTPAPPVATAGTLPPPTFTPSTTTAPPLLVATPAPTVSQAPQAPPTVPSTAVPATTAPATLSPVVNPTVAPTFAPTVAPTFGATVAPTVAATVIPTAAASVTAVPVTAAPLPTQGPPLTAPVNASLPPSPIVTVPVTDPLTSAPAQLFNATLPPAPAKTVTVPSAVTQAPVVTPSALNITLAPGLPTFTLAPIPPIPTVNLTIPTISGLNLTGLNLTTVIAALNTSRPISTPPLGVNLTVIPLVTPFTTQLNGTLAPAPPLVFPPPPPSNKNCPVPCPLGTTRRPGDLSCDCVLPMIVDMAFQRSAQQFLNNVPEYVVEVANSTNLTESQVSVQAFRVVTQSGRRLLQAVGQDLVVTTWLLPIATPVDPAPNQLTPNQTAAISQMLLDHQLILDPVLFGNYTVIQILPPGVKPPPPAPGTVPIAAPIDAPATPDPTSPAPSGSSGAGAIAGIVGGIIAGVVVLSCLVVAVLLAMRRKRRVKAPPSEMDHGKDEGLSKSFPHVFSVGSVGPETESSYPTVSGSAREFTYQEIVQATDNFNSNHILGEGGFGQVFSGKLPDGKSIAVKRLTRDGTQGVKEFVSEVDLLSHLHHKHLVKLVGYHTSARGRLLIYDLIPNGSVESHLHGIDSYDKPLDWETRVRIALGAARGLVYLHEDSNPRIIHRDFKASNILLDDAYTAKVSDFGLAKAAPDGETDHISTRVMGTFGYVAPEYAMTGHLLVKSDVYSYGVVLLELLSGRKPVDMEQPPGQENLVTWARPLLTSKQGLEQLVDPALGGRYNFDDVARVAAIASMCVQPEVSHRPFMVEVVQALKVVHQENERSTNGSDTSDIIVYDIDGRALRRKASQDLTNTGLSREFATGAPVERTNSGFHTIEYDSGVTRAESGPQSRELAQVTAAALGAGLAAAEGRNSWATQNSPASAPMPAPIRPPPPQNASVTSFFVPPTVRIPPPPDPAPLVSPPTIPPSPRSVRQFSPARRSLSQVTTPTRSRQSPLSGASAPLESPGSVNRDSPRDNFTSPGIRRPPVGTHATGAMRPSPSWARRSASLEKSTPEPRVEEEELDPSGMAPGLDYSGEMEYFNPEQSGLGGPKWARR